MGKTENKVIRMIGTISWQEREAIIQEYLSGKYTKAEIWKKYTGHKKEHGQILKWMRQLGYKVISMPRMNSNSFKKVVANTTPIRAVSSISWQERETIIQEYLSGKYTKTEIWRKYTGQEQEHGELLKWMRKLGYISHQESYPMKRSNSILDAKLAQQVDNSTREKDPIGLQKDIQALEKQLKDAQLKVEAYELMIDIAEKEFKIPIRKKSNTK
jgi:transposase